WSGLGRRCGRSQHHLAEWGELVGAVSSWQIYLLVTWEVAMDRKGPRSPKVGLALFTFDGITPDGMPGWNDLKAMAQRAEAVGFDSLWVPDHLMLAHAITKGARVAVWECWSILAALAAATDHIELGTFVACASFRNPALLAKMADTVDEISNGRLIL